MGVVFLAQDTQLGRRAAVKVMRPEVTSYDPRAYERFLREARAAKPISVARIDPPRRGQFGRGRCLL
jgi:serine/threonine protein kinase